MRGHTEQCPVFRAFAGMISYGRQMAALSSHRSVHRLAFGAEDLNVGSQRRFELGKYFFFNCSYVLRFIFPLYTNQISNHVDANYFKR